MSAPRNQQNDSLLLLYPECPSEVESQYRRIPPTPMCRDEVDLTSWLGKPLYLPTRREQAWVLRLTLGF